jgi:hypothetical protein
MAKTNMQLKQEIQDVLRKVENKITNAPGYKLIEIRERLKNVEYALDE